MGSFLNVVIYRLASGEDGIVNGRSHCRDCGHQLAWYDNIPLLSFLSLGGKCRYCHKPIAWQYPLVECAVGILFAVVAVAVLAQSITGVTVSIALLTSFIFAAMFLIFAYDLKYMEVPMIAIWLSVIAALVIVVIRYISDISNVSDVLYSVLAGVFAFTFFFSLSYFSGEKWMGYGDGFIALVIGLVLGPFWTFIALLGAVWMGAIVGIGLTFLHKKTMQSAIPFGPFLVGGLYISFVIMHFAPDMVSFLRM